MNGLLGCCAALGALVVLLPSLVMGVDGGHFLSMFGAGPAVTLTMGYLVTRAWETGHRKPAARSAFLYIALIVLFFRRVDDWRIAYRWAAEGTEYKQRLLSLSDNGGSTLQHVQWETSGFAGIAINITYVVHDPDDLLLTAARSRSEGWYPGLPCKVYRVRRLEKQWYAVDFFTDHAWNWCH